MWGAVFFTLYKHSNIELEAKSKKAFNSSKMS